jgi:hypothetical protein
MDGEAIMNAARWIASYMAAILIWPLMLYMIVIAICILPIPVMAKYCKEQLDKRDQ